MEEFLIPEPKAVLDAQFRAVVTGRKPAMLDTHHQYKCNLKSMDTSVGMVYFWDDTVVHWIEHGLIGRVLGYGVDFKPRHATGVLTVREASGQVIHDVVTDGRIEIEEAGFHVAGHDGTVEYRTPQEALRERADVETDEELLTIMQGLKHG